MGIGVVYKYNVIINIILFKVLNKYYLNFIHMYHRT